MKKFAILILVISGFTLGSMRLVNGQQASLESPPVTPEFTMSGITNVIDGIEVPQEVLEYVQLTYDGHAVTKAEKTTRDGREVYRLRVDRDDLQNDYSSFSLIFSTDWKLLGRERAAVPKPEPAPVRPQKQPATADDTEKPEQKPPKPKPEEKPEGGRGGGADMTQEETEAENTADDSENETEDETDTETETQSTTSTQN